MKLGVQAGRLVNNVHSLASAVAKEMKPQIKGSVGYTISGDKVELRVTKITHDYGNSTGTLRLQLCKNYWFYGKYSNYG